MDLKEALTTAIGYENKVHDHYAKGAAEILDPRGKKVFATLAKEELGHLTYLESRLEEWHRDGKVSTPELSTILPSMDWIEQAKARVERDPERTIAVKDEMELLKIALDLERQTSGFYRHSSRRCRLPSAGSSRASSRSRPHTSPSSRRRSTRSPVTGPGST